MALPLQAVAYEFYISLSDSLAPQNFVVDPTIAAGDFQISTDGSAFTNLATLPAVDPPGSIPVKISVSGAEMTGEKWNITGIDAAGGEWDPIFITLDIPEGSIETLLDIEEGDRIETSASLVINKKDTSTAVLSKEISGSLLSSSVTLRTTESS